eukprot:6191924-Pleurochrysis_carterae.AAC.1
MGILLNKYWRVTPCFQSTQRRPKPTFGSLGTIVSTLHRKPKVFISTSRRPLGFPKSDTATLSDAAFPVRRLHASACRRRNCLLLPLRAQPQRGGGRAPGLNPACLLARLHAL